MIKNDVMALKDLKELKEKCHTKYKTVKEVVIDIRQQLGNMYIDKLTEQMEIKIEDIHSEIQERLSKKKDIETLDLTPKIEEIEYNENSDSTLLFSSPKGTLKLDDLKEDDNI